MKKITTFCIMLFFVAAAICAVPAPQSKQASGTESQLEKLKAENKKLKAIIIKLKREIDQLKYGPSKLLTSAQNQIENQQFDKAIKTLEILLKKHPDSTEAIEAKQLMANAKESKESLKKQKEEEKKRKMARILDSMRINEDRVSEQTYYQDKSTPQTLRRKNIHIFVVKPKRKRPVLALRIQYTGDDWLFIESFTIKTDNNSYRIPVKYNEIKRDNSGGKIWEWYTNTLNPTYDKKYFKMLEDIASSEEAILRYSGQKYYSDREIPIPEKVSIKNVLEVYKQLGGKMPGRQVKKKK